VTDGEKIKLKGKGLYFIRVKRSEKINMSIANDDNCLFGEISEHSVKTLDYLINQIYLPIIDKMQKDEWGHCTGEQKKEFSDQLHGFSTELSQALKSLKNNISLPSYNQEWKNDVKACIQQSSTKAPKIEMIEQFCTLHS